MCDCNMKDLYKGNDATKYEQKYLREIKVDAYNWKTLYQCKKCKTYWEEVFLEGRFGGCPELRKVDQNYVISVWGI